MENGRRAAGASRSATSTRAGCRRKQRSPRSSRARRDSRARRSSVRAGETDLSVDPTALGLQRRRASECARGSTRPAAAATRSTSSPARCCGASRPDEVPFVLNVDPGRFDAVLDAWVAQTGKGLVDGGLQLRGHQGRRDRSRSPASGSSATRRSARCSRRSVAVRATPGSLTIGETTPAVDEEDVQRVARLARGVLAAPGDRHGEHHPARPHPGAGGTDAVDRRSSSRGSCCKTDPLKLRAAFGAPLGCARDRAGRRELRDQRHRGLRRPRRHRQAREPRRGRARRSRAVNHTIAAQVADVQPGPHDRVGPEAQHHRAGVELHHVPPVGCSRG